MAMLFNIILLIVTLILVVVCVKMWMQIYSLKKQRELHKYRLEQLSEKEEGYKQDLGKNEAGIDQSKNL
jgi:predicted Holliday junction resolvase-like endonuclease